MASTFTPNVQLEEPARGDDVGVWDTPVNSNMTIVDRILGGIATIPLNNTPVILSPAQFQSRQLTFNSTLTGNVQITFPTSFTKSYEIQNLCTGSSAFVITLQTTAAGGQAICCPPGVTIDCFNDGVNFKFKNLPPVGSYLDIATGSVPIWISNCTVPPYLSCDGSTFPSSTYPALAALFNGGNILPDSRGRARYTMNQGTGRVTAASGVAFDNFGSAGGNELLQSHAHTFTGTSQTWSTNNPDVCFGSGDASGPSGGRGVNTHGQATVTITPAGTNSATGGGGSQNMPPAYAGGMTMIRAA